MEREKDTEHGKRKKERRKERKKGEEKREEERETAGGTGACDGEALEGNAAAWWLATWRRGGRGGKEGGASLV